MQARRSYFPTKRSESLLTKWDATELQTCPEGAAEARARIKVSLRVAHKQNQAATESQHNPGPIQGGRGGPRRNGGSWEQPISLKAISHNQQGGERQLNFSPSPPTQTQPHKRSLTSATSALKSICRRQVYGYVETKVTHNAQTITHVYTQRTHNCSQLTTGRFES